MESMIKDRRYWVNQYKEKSNKIPEEIKPFYLRFDNELTPEEEEAKRLADIEAKIKKKKKTEKKDKKKKGKADDDDDDGGSNHVKIGGSEIIQKFDEFYDDYDRVWASRDETKNYNQ